MTTATVANICHVIKHTKQNKEFQSKLHRLQDSLIARKRELTSTVSLFLEACLYKLVVEKTMQSKLYTALHPETGIGIVRKEPSYIICTLSTGVCKSVKGRKQASSTSKKTSSVTSSSKTSTQLLVRVPLHELIDVLCNMLLEFWLKPSSSSRHRLSWRQLPTSVYSAMEQYLDWKQFPHISRRKQVDNMPATAFSALSPVGVLCCGKTTGAKLGRAGLALCSCSSHLLHSMLPGWV